MSRIGHVVRRASWSVIDQGLSAASNLLLSIIVARTVDADGFGAFAIAFLCFSLLIGLCRAIIGQPLQITFSSASERDFHQAVRSALGAALCLGVLSGIVLAGAGLILDGAVGSALLAVSLCLPGLLVQDTCRMAFFSAGRADRAAANDGLWTVLEFAVLAGLLLAGVSMIGPMILAWGGTATIAAVVGARVLRALPRLRGSLRWLLDQRRLSGYLVAEHFLGEGLAQVGILMVGFVSMPSEVGGLRAAQVLLGPLNIMVTAALLFGIPEIARRKELSIRGRELLGSGISALVGVITVGYAVVLLLIPDAIGEQILGDTWTGAQAVLIPMCVLALASALGTGPGAVLFGLGQARVSFILNLVKAPILIILLIVGIRWSAGLGAAWAIAAAEVIMLPVIVVAARRAIHRANPDNAEPDHGSAVIESPDNGTLAAADGPSDQ